MLSFDQLRTRLPLVPVRPRFVFTLAFWKTSGVMGVGCGCGGIKLSFVRLFHLSLHLLILAAWASSQPFLKRMYITLDDYQVLISDPSGAKLVNSDDTFTLEQVGWPVALVTRRQRRTRAGPVPRARCDSARRCHGPVT